MSLNVIVGPTSTGKTSLAIEICKKVGGVIISADSRQIVQEMDIGTGKIPLDKKTNLIKVDKYWEIEGIKIFGYDVVNPGEYFSVYDYVNFCTPLLNELKNENSNIFLVGGTGFYIDAVTGRRTIEHQEPNFEIRKKLESLSTEELAEKLKINAPEKLAKIDPKNRHRLIRALEVNMSKSEREPLVIPKTKFPKVKYIGLTAEREVLYNRADRWVDIIWEQGLVNETEKLLKKYPSSKRLDGLIYKSVKSYLRNELDKDSAVTRCKFDIHAYIRRQQTWFKLNKEIHWMNITTQNLIEKTMILCD